MINLFFDMAMVICNFESQFIQLYNQTSLELKKKFYTLHGRYDNNTYKDDIDFELFWDSYFWNLISVIPDFWINIPPFENQVRDILIFKEENPNYNYNILTLTPANYALRAAAVGKKQWLNENGFQDFKKFILPTNFIKYDIKALYAKNKNDILIDDNDNNINEWIKKGRTGILYKSASATESLYDILNDTVKEIMNER